MFNFLKKKKKVNIIADRIKNLNDKLWLISLTGKESSIESKIRYFKAGLTSREYRVMSLDTYFGERKIATDGNVLYYGNSNLIQESGENSSWSFNFNYLFYIELRKEDIFIGFSKDIKMSKEEIDLAILEFEIIVDNVYNKLSERNESYDATIRYLMQGV